MDRNTRRKMYQRHAQYCQALANPCRLEILDLLRSGELELETLRERTGIRPAALSQHLGILKDRGLVSSKKEGRRVCCRLARPKIMRACDIFREVMLEEIKEKQNLRKQLTKEQD